MAQRMPEPDESLAQSLQEDLYEAVAKMPSVQAAIASGQEWTVDASGDEVADAVRQLLYVLMDHVGRIAHEVDRLRGQHGLDQEPRS